MRIFMFVVMALFGVLAIASVIVGIALLASGLVLGGIVGLVIAGVLAIMATSVARSYHEAA